MTTLRNRFSNEYKQGEERGTVLVVSTSSCKQQASKIRHSSSVLQYKIYPIEATLGDPTQMPALPYSIFTLSFPKRQNDHPSPTKQMIAKHVIKFQVLFM